MRQTEVGAVRRWEDQEPSLWCDRGSARALWYVYVNGYAPFSTHTLLEDQSDQAPSDLMQIAEQASARIGQLLTPAENSP